MLRSLIRKLFPAHAENDEIDAIVERGVDNISVEELDRVYRAGCDLVWPYLELHDRAGRPADEAKACRDVEYSIKLLSFVVRAQPRLWSAHWTIGKAHQTLGNSHAAFLAFGTAFKVQQGHPDVAREYMFECLNLGRGEEAVDVARHAVSLEPRDAGLQANLALALLINADLDAATEAVNAALAMSPNDVITQGVAQVIEEVKSGQRPQPNRMADLRR